MELLDKIEKLDAIVRIPIVALAAYLFQLGVCFSFFGRPNSSGKTAEVRCFGYDSAVLLSSTLAYIGSTFAFPKLLSPFHWSYFIVAVLLFIAGWLYDYFEFRSAPKVYCDEGGHK